MHREIVVDLAVTILRIGVAPCGTRTTGRPAGAEPLRRDVGAETGIIRRMKVTLVFVPQGGGEADYQLDIDMPALPRPGDYVRVRRPPDEVKTADFIVRRTWWDVRYPNNESYGPSSGPSPLGTTEGFFVECEYALSPMSTDSHKRMYEAYKHRGKPDREFDDTAY